MLKAVKSNKTITIFEGPDGSGKSTLAREYAERIGAKYVHFDALYGVKNIHKYFMEAMLPALMGYQSVVLDRCWHSGPIYDMVFRNLEEREQRQTPEICTLLDRAAAFCNAVYVNCRPPEDVCISNWKSRLGSELIKSEHEMRAIYRLYGENRRSICLPVVEVDYTKGHNAVYPDFTSEVLNRILQERNAVYHSRQPRVHIIVSSSMEKTDVDTMLDVPGVRFHPNSNEFKLATDFSMYGTWEDGPVVEELVNYVSPTDSLLEYFRDIGPDSPTQYVFAIGPDAVEAAEKFVNMAENLAHYLPIHIMCLLNTIADARMRELYGAVPLAKQILSVWNETAKQQGTETPSSNEVESEPADSTVGRVESEVCEGPGGLKGVALKFNSIEDLKLVNVADLIKQVVGDDAK